MGAWGFIIRNSSSDSVLVGAGNEGYTHDALMAEAVACLKALEMAVEHGISHVVIETDSSLLVNALLTTERDLCSRQSKNF